MKSQRHIYTNIKLVTLLVTQLIARMEVFKFINGVFIIRIFSCPCIKEGSKSGSLLDPRPKQYIDLEPLQARKNFEGKGKKTFDLTEFRTAPIRIVYDSLHGISTVGIHGQLDRWNYIGHII